MARTTRDQVRADIVDRAAALFARQGVAHTALQQIADAIGYSKAGVLHHFPSKDAIADAAWATAGDRISALADRLAGLPEGIERDGALVEATVDLTYEWPGVAQLAASVAEQADAVGDDLLLAAARLAEVTGASPDDEDRAVRVIVATSGATWAALTAGQADRRREWRSAIVRSGLQALGHTD